MVKLFAACRIALIAVIGSGTLLTLTWLLTNRSSSIHIKSHTDSSSLEIELKSNETVKLENQRKLPE